MEDQLGRRTKTKAAATLRTTIWLMTKAGAPEAKKPQCFTRLGVISNRAGSGT
jgi:hypothetical protein